MRTTARQKRASTQTTTMTAMIVLETFCVFVIAVDSAEPLLALALGDGVATGGDTLTCASGGAVGDEDEDEVDSESSSDEAVPDAELSGDGDGLAEVVDVLGGESEVELGSAE